MTALIWIDRNTGKRNNSGLTALSRKLGIADNQLLKIRGKVIKGQQTKFARQGLNGKGRHILIVATNVARPLRIKPQSIDLKFRAQTIPSDTHIIHRDRNAQSRSNKLF